MFLKFKPDVKLFLRIVSNQIFEIQLFEFYTYIPPISNLVRHDYGGGQIICYHILYPLHLNLNLTRFTYMLLEINIINLYMQTFVT